MSIDNTKYRNYIFDFKAAAALFAGLFIGIMVLGLYTLFAYFILKQGYTEIQQYGIFHRELSLYSAFSDYRF